MKIDLTKQEIILLRAYHLKYLSKYEIDLQNLDNSPNKTVINRHITRLKLLGINITIKDYSFVVGE